MPRPPVSECPRLEEFLHKNAGDLLRDASVQIRGKHARFRSRVECPDGIRRRISIAIPDGDIAERLKSMIKNVRDLGPGIAALIRKRDAMLKSLERKFISLCPKSHRHRKLLKRSFRFAANRGMSQLQHFIQQKPWLLKPNPVGRPKKVRGLF